MLLGRQLVLIQQLYVVTCVSQMLRSGQGFQITQITQITVQLQIRTIAGDRAERTYLAGLRLGRRLRPRHGAIITTAGAMFSSCSWL